MRTTPSETVGAITDEILAGLSQVQKRLPAKLFYDVEGCRLFKQITTLPEYYVTRVEQALLAQITPELPRFPDSVLVEYGASDESKALTILDHIGASTYVPIDIAAEALEALKTRLALVRSKLHVLPIVTDFLEPVELPAAMSTKDKFGFFPGSTIGNLDPPNATAFLTRAKATLGTDAKFLVGVDVRKDPAILLPAYDDAQGVTAAFNLNLLTRLNREVGAHFDPLSFRHRAAWNSVEGRIEMHLVSSREQTVLVAGEQIHFSAGETIHTENSYKHTVDSFRSIASSAGWSSDTVWTDKLSMFSLHLLVAT